MINSLLNKYILPFTNCIITRGYNRGSIIDTQRKKYALVPLGLVDFLAAMKNKRLHEVIGEFTYEDRATLEEYLEYLFDNEFAFICDEPEELELFPEMDMTWKYPAIISNGVVLVTGKDSVVAFNSFKGDFYIPYIQFYIVDPVIDINALVEYVRLMVYKNIKGVQVIFNNLYNLPKDDIISLCNEHQIETLIAYNSSFEKDFKSNVSSIYFRTEKCVNYKNCGIVNEEYFNVQFEHITESFNHNTCLNRKIAIDAEGNIKNCPAMTKSYGNVRDTSLFKVVQDPEFQKMWNIKKDDISKCKDCEFRHICTDCRAYVDDPADPYSAPLKCGYDPYTNAWEEWSTLPFKQKAIAFYGMQDLATVKAPTL